MKEYTQIALTLAPFIFLVFYDSLKNNKSIQNDDQDKQQTPKQQNVLNKLLNLPPSIDTSKISKSLIQQFELFNDPDGVASIIPQRSSFTLIDSKPKLEQLVKSILESGERVIGIDSENESINTYKGFLCLIQCSTLHSDYVIDLLSIDDSEFVGETFGKLILENEDIVKVVHGGSSDKAWVFRDFGINITNIFDTQDIYVRVSHSLDWYFHYIYSQ